MLYKVQTFDKINHIIKHDDIIEIIPYDNTFKFIYLKWWEKLYYFLFDEIEALYYHSTFKNNHFYRVGVTEYIIVFSNAEVRFFDNFIIAIDSF